MSFQLSAKTFSQTITLSEKNVPLQTIFLQISKQIGYNFLYTDELLQNTKNVDIDVKNAPLEQVLQQCFINQPLTFQIVNKTVILKSVIAKEPVSAETANVLITGKVTDEKGDPLVGVTIKMKNSTLVVTTDASGNFFINVSSSSAVLQVSYLGYVTQDVNITGKTRLNIQLESDAKALSEVVVVGYNSVKKSDVTGAVISVSAEEIRSRPVSNALQAIQGKAAGVDVTSTDRPGQLGSILIRGQRSLTASSSPLYVVDGVPLATGGIEAINPNDIQSMDILKDASATAIYGSRGANGVVIVTTKRGKAGNLSLDYVGTTTIEKLVDRTHMMNSAEYIEFRRDAYRRLNFLDQFNGIPVPANAGYPAVPTLANDQRIFPNDPIAFANINKGWQTGTFDPGQVPTTDWPHMVTKTAITQNHTVSVSGGTEKIRAYASFGYLHQNGTQIGQDYERYSGNMSVDITPVKWFTMGGSMNITSSTQNYGFSSSSATGPGSIYAAAQGMLPYAVPFDPTTGARINLPGGDIGILNPIGEDQNNINRRTILRTLGSLYSEITFLPGLKYRVNFGPDFYNYQNGQFQSANAINRGGGQPGSTNFADLNRDNKFAYTLDNLIYYNKTVGKHDFGLTLLQSNSLNRDEPSDMSATNLPYDSQLWYQLNSVSALNSFSSGLTKTTLTSYMARGTYSFNSKYLLTASARWDGASQLAPGHKWDFFPSLAMAWRLDQEKFIKSLSWVDQLKARLGVGVTGNSAIGAYTTKGRLQTLYYTFGSSVQPGYVSSDASLATPISLPNPDLGWEHTTQYNLGIDFSLFKGRVSGVLDVYTSRTTNLLLLRSIPSINGYVTSLENVAVSSNRGIDLTLNTVNIKAHDFSWSTTLNFSANKDKIVELENGKSDDINNLWFIGQRLNVYYDYQKIGIWQNTPADLAEIAKYKANGQIFYPGNIKIKDINGDYKIDANNDRTIVGHANPNWIGGLTNTFDYKSFSLSVFMYARWGFTQKLGAETLQGRYAQRELDYWTPTNPTNDYPAPNYASTTGDTYATSLTYQNASFITIRNISLGYFLPNSVSKKLGVSKIKVYTQVINPTIVYSKISWINPDTGTSTYNRGLVLGLNVGF